LEGKNRNFRILIIVICAITLLKLVLPVSIQYGNLYYRNNDFSLYFYYGLRVNTFNYYSPYLNFYISLILLLTIIPILIATLILLIILIVKINELKPETARVLGVLSVVLLSLEPIVYSIVSNIFYNYGLISIPLSGLCLNFFFALIVGFGTLRNYKKTEDHIDDIKKRQNGYFHRLFIIICIILFLQLLVPTGILFRSDGTLYGIFFYHGISVRSYSGIDLNPLVSISMMIAILILLIILTVKTNMLGQTKFKVLGIMCCFLLFLFPIILYFMDNLQLFFQFNLTYFGEMIHITMINFYQNFFFALIVGFGILQICK